MIVVSDTSAISNLLRIGEIDLLRLTFSRVLIPTAVYDEIYKIEANRKALENIDWIERVEISEIGLRDELLRRLHKGEAEAIALAVELSADFLLIDEAEGRRVARSMGVRITGLLGVLSRAKIDGHIDLIRPYIDRLVLEANFRLGQSLIDETLFQAGEK